MKKAVLVYARILGRHFFLIALLLGAVGIDLAVLSRPAARWTMVPVEGHTLVATGECEYRFSIATHGEVRLRQCIDAENLRDMRELGALAEGTVVRDGSFLVERLRTNCPSKFDPDAVQRWPRCYPFATAAVISQ